MTNLTIRSTFRKPFARRQDAFGFFVALTTYAKSSVTDRMSTDSITETNNSKTFFDDLANAIWIVVVIAAIPGFILASMCQLHTTRMQYQTQYTNASQPTQNIHHTPDGFGVPIAHGGEHDPQKQE